MVYGENNNTFYSLLWGSKESFKPYQNMNKIEISIVNVLGWQYMIDLIMICTLQWNISKTPGPDFEPGLAGISRLHFPFMWSIWIQRNIKHVHCSKYFVAVISGVFL